LAAKVPAHIGTPTPGYGYETGDPYADYLPPAIPMPANEDAFALRAAVIVTEGARKGTERSGQEYVEPLLVLASDEYKSLSF
jgi:hypothetical protein